ncbi:uncharacterized protein G2W53_039942 [Senna tora]|uniref:Uncharacterized protein n=1 Tax=Senna tora TaxID=362788 RepID=A0A834SQL7_9FABA|nr:uncharacterized protein G2W53_039942 [Senna tora]
MDNPSKGQHIPKGRAVAIKWQHITATTANNRETIYTEGTRHLSGKPPTDHFDSAYAREILPRKKVDPWVIDFGWTATHDDPSRRPSKIWPRASRIALKLLGRFPCVIGFILTHHMHVRFCLEKNLTHDSLIFDGRRSTWSTTGRPTGMALKLLRRLPCVIGIILTRHMHVTFCLEKEVDPWVIDFGWMATDDDPSRRPSKIWPRASRIALKLLGRLPCVIGFILAHHMHVRFCVEKKLTHDSLIFDGRRATWSTIGRSTRMALKLLGRLPCVIGIIFTRHMHVRFCLEK